MIQSRLDRNLSTQKSHELWASQWNLSKWCPERISCPLWEQACSNGTTCCGWCGSAPQNSSNTQINHGILLQLHILLRFISLQLCTENIMGRSSLMFGIYKTTEPPVLNSFDKAEWLEEVGRQCLVTPVIQRCHERPPLHSWNDFAKEIQKHSEDQIPPLQSSLLLLLWSSFSVSVSFLHALALRLCLALVSGKFTVNT